MEEPFPELTSLDLRSMDRNAVLVLPDSFLGGSAPRLRTLRFCGISFLAIPKLLLSAGGDLVQLVLSNIPHSGYISPWAMATALSTLTRLEQLEIGFQSPRSRPGPSSPPWSTQTVLPSLGSFRFRGVSKFLEDLTARIDAPLLSNLNITFFNQLIFKLPRLCSFISHAEKLRSQSQARVAFDRGAVELSHMTCGRPGPGLKLTILCRASDWQLSALSQVCASPFPSLLNLERLQIYEYPYLPPHWQEDVETTQWLELLRPFTTVKSLSLTKEFAPLVVPALQELFGERIMEVLPALQSIFLPKSSLSGPVKKALEQFLTARQLSGHPVAVNPWEQEQMY